MRASRPLAAAALLALTLAACSGAVDQTPTTTTEVPGDASAFPVTITHALGETVIESLPTRVATVGWSNQEAALALGVVPVIMESATWGDDDKDGILPWVEDKIAELGAPTPDLYDGTAGIDFAAIDAAQPDVILSAYSGMTQDDYDTLSQIAPVVAYPEQAWGTTWQEMTIMNGTALGLRPEAQAQVSDLEAQLADAAAQYPDLAGASAMFTSVDPTDLSAIGFYTLHDPRGLFFSQIGMSTPAEVTSLSDSEAGFWLQVSAEEVDSFSDVDVLVSYGDDTTLATVQADPLYSRIPAVASGAVVVLTNDTPLAASSNPSPLGIPYLIENYLPMLDAAAAAAAGS